MGVEAQSPTLEPKHRLAIFDAKQHLAESLIVGLLVGGVVQPNDH